jgi:nucleoside-diphosphate-sugar epimerase
MAIRMKHLLCFGFGFSARTLAARLSPEEWRITGTSRTAEGAAQITALGYEGVGFDAMSDIPATVTHVVVSAPPDQVGDPVLARFGTALALRAQQIKWLAYLSTTGVYGDHQGAWIDENTPLTPNTDRGQRRVDAEAAWLDLWRRYGLGVEIFRLAGIYGPGRSSFEGLLKGTAKRVIKENQVFSRIHVADIAGVLLAAMAKANPGRCYNVADDEPCPPQDVISYAATLLGLPVPPDIPFEQAELSPMAASFYADSKRTRNDRVKQELGYQFQFPTYREGLTAILPTLKR